MRPSKLSQQTIAFCKVIQESGCSPASNWCQTFSFAAFLSHQFHSRNVCESMFPDCCYQAEMRTNNSMLDRDSETKKLGY